MKGSASSLWLVGAALASAVLLVVLLTGNSGAESGQRVANAQALAERAAPDLAEAPETPAPAAEGTTPTQTDDRPPVRRAAAAAAPVNRETWHFRVRTAARSRRPLGHRFVIELGTVEEPTGRALVQGRTDWRGRADVTWTPPPELAGARLFTCRLTEEDCVPHRVNLRPLDLDGRRRAKAFLVPKPYSRSGVQAVDAEGERIACTYFLLQDGAEPEELGDAPLGYMAIPERHARKQGFIYALNSSHGTGRVRLETLESGEGEPHQLTLRIDGGARGRVVTASGAPLAGVHLRLQWIPEAGTPLQRVTSRRSIVGDGAPPIAGVLVGAGEGKGEAVVTTDSEGRFQALDLCPGKFDVRLVLNGVHEVSIGHVESFPGAPEKDLAVPYTWVTFRETPHEGHVRAVYDITDGGSAAESVAHGPGIWRLSARSFVRNGAGARLEGLRPEVTAAGSSNESRDAISPRALAPRIEVGNRRRALLRTGRVYEAVVVGVEPLELTIVRSVRFNLTGGISTLTVDLR